MGSLHEGERSAQRRAGVHERMAEVMGQVVRPFMPDQHREFFGKLPTLVVGAIDAQRRPWASIVSGPPGFVGSPDARHLRIAARPAEDDPWQLAVDTPLGFLGLEPHTRRRNRLNGSVVEVDADGFTVEVDQSFGNCPKYIQARVPRPLGRTAQSARRLGPVLEDEARALVANADTLFIASASPDARAHADADGVDVSHRGGPPGFVQPHEVDGATVLTWPDFRGNNFFNTIGNLAANPRAGLLFIDYDEGHLLQLTGRTEVQWDGPELDDVACALRLMHFTVEAAVWRAHALPLQWSPPEYAPQFEEMT